MRSWVSSRNEAAYKAEVQSIRICGQKELTLSIHHEACRNLNFCSVCFVSESYPTCDRCSVRVQAMFG